MKGVYMNKAQERQPDNPAERTTYGSLYSAAANKSSKFTSLDSAPKSKIPQKLTITGDNIAHLKIKAFKQALGEAIRYLYYVSYALVKGQVKRADDSFDSVTRLFEVVSPTLSSLIPTMKTDLAFSLLNVIFEVIRKIRDANAVAAANNVVRAFQGGYGRVDVNLVKEIARVFAYRFSDQIKHMSISMSTCGKLRLHECDGVVQFANIIAQRIGAHITEGKSEFVDQNNNALIQAISYVGKTIKVLGQQAIGDAQNVKAEIRMPTLHRCLFASWMELVGYDSEIECDIIMNGQHVLWPAGDILTYTGIRDIQNPTMHYIRLGYFNEDIGYIFAEEWEWKRREYIFKENKQDNIKKEIERGRKLHEEKKYKESLDVFIKLLESGIRDPEILYWHARNDRYFGQNERALAYLNIVLEEVDKNNQLYYSALLDRATITHKNAEELAKKDLSNIIEKCNEKEDAFSKEMFSKAKQLISDIDKRYVALAELESTNRDLSRGSGVSASK